GRALHEGYAEDQGAKARFRGPTGLAADGAGNFYVADTNNQVLRRVSADLGAGAPRGLRRGSGRKGALSRPHRPRRRRRRQLLRRRHQQPGPPPRVRRSRGGRSTRATPRIRAQRRAFAAPPASPPTAPATSTSPTPTTRSSAACPP